MKREDFIKSGGSLPPFSENLVFWAPLEEGDVTEVLHGITPTTDSGCSFVFDANKQMYRLNASGGSSSYRGALKYSNVGMGMGNNHECTIVIDVEEISISGNRYSAMIATPIIQNNISITYCCNARYFNSINKNLHRYVAVYGGLNQGEQNTFERCYYDGILCYDAVWQGLPIANDSVSLCQLHRNNTQYSIYAKNARVYNKAFTTEEVAQL